MSNAHGPKTAPYAPPGNVLNLLQWCRQNALPDQIDSAFVERAGTSAGNSSRTLVALRFLGLVDIDGNVSDEFRLLCGGDADTYPELLAEIVRTAYDGIFAIVDPAQGDLKAINDAFQDYEPAGQRDRMAALFVALCREAGIMQGGTYRQRPLIVNRRRPSRQKASSASKVSKSEVDEVSATNAEDTSPNQRLIGAVVERLPKGSTWTRAQRDRWLQLLTAAIDNLWEVEDDLNQKA